jgi:hypothetical protein
MKTTYRRLGISTVAIIVAATSYLSSSETVLGQSHYVAAAPDSDVRLRTFADTMERELITSQSMPVDITTTFASAVELFPNASVAGRQVLINLPQRLRAKAVEQRNEGSAVQAINLEVFADFVTKYFTYHAAVAGSGTAPTVTPLSVTTASTDEPQASPEQTAVSVQPTPPEGLHQQIQGLQQQVQALQEQVTQQNQQLAALRTNGDKGHANATNPTGQRRATVRHAHTLPCVTHTGSMVAVTEKASWVAGRLGHGCVFYQF